MPERNEEVRKKLQAKLSEKGKEYLYGKLRKVDPESAENNRHNPQRLIRALEVFEVTGIPISSLQKKTVKPDEDFVQFGLDWPREIIYRRIDRRAQEMLRSGMIEETKRLLSEGLSETAEAFKGIGYRDILDYIAGKIDRKELEECLKRDTRRYAKRQLTWFRKDKRINWIDLKESSFSAENTARIILKMVHNLV
jgi:tRNA dimethylallyltransferase